jgi:hypothetical protein
LIDDAIDDIASSALRAATMIKSKSLMLHLSFMDVYWSGAEVTVSLPISSPVGSMVVWRHETPPSRPIEAHFLNQHYPRGSPVICLTLEVQNCLKTQLKERECMLYVQT